MSAPTRGEPLTLGRVTRTASNRANAVRVPKTAELLATHVRKQIVRGELAEGEALPSESMLMEEFSVSRPTLREAFRILESEGLITVRRGARGGARVQVPSPEVAARYTGLVLQHRGTTLADVFDARVVVEAPAAGILARRSDRVQCAAKISEWLDDFESTWSTEDVGYSANFHGFNRLLVALTENETMVVITSMLESISDAATVGYLAGPHTEDPKIGRRVSRARRKLIELISAGEADAAEQLFRQHLAEAGQVLMAAQGGRVVDVLS